MREHRFVGPAPISARAEQVMVRMRDGVRLATDVYLPDGAGRAPAVLARVPYDKSSLYTGMEQIAQAFTTAGYAFVAQDVRGKFRSEGERMPWLHEPADGADTIEWLASASFCDGRVGMVGDSYYGFTQWAAASQAPPALRAIVPRFSSGVVDAVGFNHGPFALAGPVGWLAFAWIDDGIHEGALDWSHRPLVDVVEASFGLHCAPMDTLLARGFPWAWTTYPGVLRRERVRVPVLHWAGWWDNLRRGSFRQYRTMLHQAGAGPQHLIVDSTDHELAKLGRSGPALLELSAAGDADGVAAFWAQELRPAIDFLDRHVRGIGEHVIPPVRWHLGHVGWQDADRWPPPGARGLELFLGDAARSLADADGGSLELGVPAAQRVRWHHDPADLVPDLTPDPSGYSQLLTPVDETPVQSRPDVPTFTSDATRQPLDLVGPAVVSADVESSHASMQLVAKLVDVDPSGTTQLIAEGARIVHGHRYGGLVDVDLGDVGYRMRPGHRMRLELASSRFPRYLPHPGTDEDPWLAVTGSTTTQTLRAGGTHPSRLRLTVLPRGAGG